VPRVELRPRGHLGREGASIDPRLPPTARHGG
jgi:hypothetical protein